MTDELNEHLTVEEFTSIQWVNVHGIYILAVFLGKD